MMDHHCYFINNCVGVYNMKSYIQFLIGMMMFIFQYFLSAIFVSGLIYKSTFYQTSKVSFLFQEFLGIIIMLKGCYFFPYIFNLLKKSLKAVYLNQTEVESVKNLQSENLNYKKAFSKVFGSTLISCVIPSSYNLDPNFLEETHFKNGQTQLQKSEKPL